MEVADGSGGRSQSWEQGDWEYPNRSLNKSERPWCRKDIKTLGKLDK